MVWGAVSYNRKTDLVHVPGNLEISWCWVPCVDSSTQNVQWVRGLLEGQVLTNPMSHWNNHRL